MLVINIIVGINLYVNAKRNIFILFDMACIVEYNKLVVLDGNWSLKVTLRTTRFKIQNFYVMLTLWLCFVRRVLKIAKRDC
jgi:hypothetical protein